MNIQQIKPAGLDGRVPPGPVLGEEKIDGHRALFHFGHGLDRGYMTGRRVSKQTGLYTEKGECVPHILNQAMRLVQKRCGYTVLDGELVLSGMNFESIQSVMGSSSQRAVDWQCANQLMEYVVFDVLFWNGIDIRTKPREARFMVARAIVGKLRSPYIRLVEQRRLECREDRVQMFDEVTAAGGEGIVIKTINGKYGFGQRRLKVEKTFDVVITGFTDAKEGKTGKFKGLIGAVRFGAYRDGKMVELGKCSGMSDTLRRRFSSAKKEFLGQVIEVKCNGITRHGRLRHPQFKRFRPDKASEECLAPAT